MQEKPDPSIFYHLTRPAAVLRVTGPDSFAFLQSQFSNDLKIPDVEKPVTYGLWLNHKGKIQADSFVLQLGETEFLVVSYDCTTAIIRRHLEAHLIADEVELQDETSGLGLLHVWSDKSFEEAEALADRIVDSTECEVWIGRRPTAFSSWDFLANSATLETIVYRLQGEGALPAVSEDLHGLRIIAGIPAIPVDAGPGDLPQEAGLERDAVAFDKGCYLGQEIMARLHTQGHVNRKLWQMGWSKDVTVAPGLEPVPLYAGEVQAGELRSRVSNESGGLGLAMVKTSAIVGCSALSLAPNRPGVLHFLKDLTASLID